MPCLFYHRIPLIIQNFLIVLRDFSLNTISGNFWQSSMAPKKKVCLLLLFCVINLTTSLLKEACTCRFHAIDYASDDSQHAEIPEINR